MTTWQPARSLRAGRRFRAIFWKRANRRRSIRYGLLALNVVLLGGTLLFVLQTPHAGVALQKTAPSGDDVSAATANPLDQLASANIAVTVARLDNMPEATPIANQADSQVAELAIASTNNNVIAKPQVVATALNSKAGIKVYYTKSDQTVASIAAKFGVSANSIRWSNNLLSDTVAIGQKLYIPPVNGIVYVVQRGDTPASLAQKFNAKKSAIIAFNDAEINGLRPGERIVIPDGTTAAAVQTVSYTAASSAPTAFPWGSSPIYGYNGYDYGYCTWYVASRIPVPSNWGNASTWSYYASMSGWNVSPHPSVGSIAQTPYAAGGEGHVAIVEAVSADGQSVKISDMNGLAGWGTVGTGWEPVSKYPNYISH